MLRRWLALTLILTAPTGCDNVAWGGVDMRLEGPPSPANARPQAADSAAAADPSLPPLPEGPLLLAGQREGSVATMVVVGEVLGGGLRPLPDEATAPGYIDYLNGRLLTPGTRFVLFSNGTRVGSLTVESAGRDDRFCQPRPTVTGRVELVPEAAPARRLLALSAAHAADRPYGPFQALEHDYDQRVASLNLAAEAIPQVGAVWPSSMLEARADIQAFRVPEAEGPSMAATFLFRDRLAVTSAQDAAYSLFILGTQRNGSIQRAFTWYRRVGDDGKGAPRYFDHLDWDGDGASEILLDVFGSGSRWFAEIERAGESWRQGFQDPCGAPESEG